MPISNFKQDSYAPRWLHYGVLKSPPHQEHSTWRYVSSGMSHPREAEQPQEHSGLGAELVLETEKETTWAVDIVCNLVAFNILLAHGKFGDVPLLDYGHRVPISIAREGGLPPAITHVMLIEPRHYPNSFHLVSGKVDLLHVIGITDAGLAFVQEHGTTELLARLVEAGVYPVTGENRESVV